MFVSGGLPWEFATSPIIPPLGGLLTMLEGKEGVRAPIVIPPAVPRTAACIVLPQPNASPTTTLGPPLSPLHTSKTHTNHPLTTYTNSSSPSSSPRHTSASHPLTTYSNSSSPSTPPPPLKFGVERLLAVEPRKEATALTHHSTSIFSPPLATSSGTCHALGTTTCPVITSANTSTHGAPCPGYNTPLNCPILPPCGCDLTTGSKCPTECGYYYTSLYPGHLMPYASLYGGSLGGGHRHDMMGVVPSGSHHGRRKRTWTRAVFSNLQRKGLEKRFQLQKYITKPDRRQLAATLGLTDAQVKVWFQNRRMKWRHAEIKKREQQQQQQKQDQAPTDHGQQIIAAVGAVVGGGEIALEKGEVDDHLHCLEGHDDEDEDEDDDDEEIDPVEGATECLQMNFGVV